MGRTLRTSDRPGSTRRAIARAYAVTNSNRSATTAAIQASLASLPSSLDLLAQPAMKNLSLLLAGLLIVAPACMAQTSDDASAAASASELDLALPKSSTYQHHNDPPGTWYGDTSRVPAAAATAAQAPAREERCKGELHGAVAAGVGYSSRAGNSNWQALNVNSCKTYYNDDGDARELGFSISVGQYDGPDGRGRTSPPMRGPRR